MSKGIKNVLIVFTLICGIAFFVFVVQLISLNRGRSDSDGNGANESQSASTSGDESAPDSSQASQGNGNGLAQGDNGADSQQTPDVLSGRRYELYYTSAQRLVLYADEEMFIHDSEMETADMFTYNDEGNASLLINFVSLPLGAQNEAESFLEGYLEGNPSYVSGLVHIKNSSLMGVYVSGVNAGETFEAWIHSIPDNDSDPSNDIGMAFVVRYRNNVQKNAIFAILDSLELTNP